MTRWPSFYTGDEYFAASLWLPTWWGSHSWLAIFFDFTGSPWWGSRGRRCVRMVWV